MRPSEFDVPATQGNEATQSEEAVDRRGLRILSLDECLSRVRAAKVGRVAFEQAGETVILPVNHGLDGIDVVFRTTWGSKLQVAADASSVAFEVDGFDEVTKTGWSVLIKARASLVYEAAERERLDTLGVSSWADFDVEAFWVRLRAEEVSGRELRRRD